MESIGKSPIRKDAWEKVTGHAKYTADLETGDTLHAALLISPYAHARILSIDLSKAKSEPGVRAILTGKEAPHLTGEKIKDRPILARDLVRYHGEAVAVVVADTLEQALWATRLIKVNYDPLPVIHTPIQAYQKQALLLHEHLGEYKTEEGVRPEPGTNIAHRIKIRKGDRLKGWSESAVETEVHISFPPSDHAAMETRSVSAEIRPKDNVIIYSSSQAPYTIKKQLSAVFGIEQHLITVHTPLVGGAYGGKGAIQLEFIAYMASRAVGGRKVKLTNSREHDFITSPVHIGLDAWVKLGADQKGQLKVAEFLFLFDGGGYADKAIDMAQAAAADSTGPYNIENLYGDSLSMYTNHPYATAFRGFGHPECTFAFERAMEQLADKLSMDPLEFRLKNAIQYGDTSPTQVLLNENLIGNTRGALEELKRLIEWKDGERIEAVGPNTVRAKGISCFWKNSTIAGNAGSGAVVIFDHNGGVHLSCGVVEIGQGSRSVLTQIAAQALQLSPEKISVEMEVNTSLEPEHWKTVASRGMWMAGRAVLRACEDAIHQLIQTASYVFKRRPEDLTIGDEYVFIKAEPDRKLSYKELAFGYIFPNGNSIGNQVIGRGQFTINNTTKLDPETGKGKSGPDWTVGAQAVEVELNTRDFTYKLIKAITVMDAGTIINPMYAEGQVKGAMHMGLSFASREGFIFDQLGRVINNQFRTYKVTRFGENPEFQVAFIATPSKETAYGLRGLGEHGLIGMPAALANSLSRAAGVQLNHLPLVPEYIWRVKTGDQT
jgi:CO/xanthine dehydrogenase Mo-binding subunit